MSHTPGPWKIAENNLGCKDIIPDRGKTPELAYGEDPEPIFCLDSTPDDSKRQYIGYTSGLADEAQDGANACLIKKSPEMLKKLEEIEFCCHPTGLTILPNSILANSLRRLIKEAKGEK
ncbi:hypothetical protein LCGC14_1306940 [marine sediment metagenome]|uniref:Uncharacterized protein n=1 Tax=marine sediment metagenome TaxID=412755 RepID=A0A0F9NQZ2_9ZZZZ